MSQLIVVWRNSNPVRRPRARRIQKFEFGRALYSVEELVSSGDRDLWLRTSSLEVCASHPEKNSSVDSLSPTQQRDAACAEQQAATGGK
jgi:hypothetical protein